MKYCFLLLSWILFLSAEARPPGINRMIPTTDLTVNSTLKSVTVFRTGAEMYHTATATLRQGNNELSIEGISSFLDLNSIQVKCPATVTILGYEFSNSYSAEESMTPEVKKIKDSLESFNVAWEKNEIQIRTHQDLLDVLQKNKDVKGSQSGLSVAELTKLMNYYEAKSVEVQNKLLVFRNIRTKMELERNRLNNQLSEEQKKNTTKGGRLILQLNVGLAGNHQFELTYITQNAWWTPYYDIKADNIKSPLKFVHRAKIAQTTGIDWKKIKLSLSTSTPTHFDNAPVFKTWFLSYIDPVRVLQGKVSGLTSNTIPSASLQEVVVVGYGKKEYNDEAETVRVRGAGTVNSNNPPLYIVDGAEMSANDFSKINQNIIKSMQVLKGDNATSIYGSRANNGVIVVTLKDDLSDYITVSSSELDITYDIDIPYDIQTNGKPQLATLMEQTIPATYKYYAVPKLDKEAYLLAEVANWQTLNLLPGEANVIFEGTYIGKTFLDPASTSDTLNLTLGTDKRVVIKRELKKDFSSTKLIGSNKLQVITYDITVKNNKQDAISLILKDQFPISTNKDIEVELLEHSNGSVNKEIGVVTWQMKIEPGQSQKYRISYSVKYPKYRQVNL